MASPAKGLVDAIIFFTLTFVLRCAFQPQCRRESQQQQMSEQTRHYPAQSPELKSFFKRTVVSSVIPWLTAKIISVRGAPRMRRRSARARELRGKRWLTMQRSLWISRPLPPRRPLPSRPKPQNPQKKPSTSFPGITGQAPTRSVFSP